MMSDGLTGNSRRTGPSGRRTYGRKSASLIEGSNQITGLSLVKNGKSVLFGLIMQHTKADSIKHLTKSFYHRHHGVNRLMRIDRDFNLVK